MELTFKEDGLLVKTISAYDDMEAALRLRHQVFREELKWVPPSPDGLDRDEYDRYAQGIGVFDEKNELLGHVRLIHAPLPFMIEKDFASLLPQDGSFRKKRGMMEATRICIRREVRSERHLSMTLVHLIYKAMYHWSKANEIGHLVTIVEKRYYVLLKRSKFPFRPVGDFKPLGEGVLSGVITLDWGEFDSVISSERPEFFEWFTRLEDFDLRRLLRHGSY
ncbi:MAG TPA: acyl-homoserine-lactone synthase [Thermodesulfobacteriota bacterium]|nr:acyl-homoserine-lactone synthase [Thermodesulfobacteriota bacterium]